MNFTPDDERHLLPSNGANLNYSNPSKLDHHNHHQRQKAAAVVLFMSSSISIFRSPRKRRSTAVLDQWASRASGSANSGLEVRDAWADMRWRANIYVVAVAAASVGQWSSGSSKLAHWGLSSGAQVYLVVKQRNEFLALALRAQCSCAK